MTFPPSPSPAPPSPRPAPPVTAPSKVPKYLLIGCGSLLVVALIGGVAAYFLFWTAVDQVLTTFTTEKPLAIPTVDLPLAEYNLLEERVRAFSQAVDGAGNGEALVLSETEINALIQRHSQFKEPGSGVAVRIIADQLEAELSIPAGSISPALEGRFLNGKALIGVGMRDGRVAAFLEDLRIGDRYLPDGFRDRMHKENLLRNVYAQDDDLSRALRRIRWVEIRNGSLILTPAAPSNPNPGSSAPGSTAP